jgi:hypothetical protein
MLNIKEACRYANFLDEIYLELQMEFSQENYIFTTTEKHLKSKACLNTEDEVIDASPDNKYDISNIKLNGIANLLMDILDEKLKLALAIEEGKKQVKLDWVEDGKNLTLDAALEHNKKLRAAADTFLRQLTDIKSSEIKKLGTDYTFNQEGNQVPYRYNIEVIKTINYDRNAIKKLYKKILKKTDEISIQIDQIMLKEVVDFTPKFDLHDSMGEIIENYSTKN